ncbi:FimV family protein [Pseudothauera hydrothermalis]|uniref:type IV pilus assembly protein FimV n=1 Tax=Pseudothauera hydrothermalis TaxID=2184083 RepID=UPI0013C2B08E|nr:hypothetical protein [Pseudothauera hydrothermalis]
MHAVALGEVLSLSALGEPLRIDIQLAAGTLDEAGECLRIAPGAAGAGPWVSRARISTSSHNGKVVTISAPTPINEPVLRLGIDNVCAARLRREYTLLLPFPVTRPTAADQTVANPVANPMAADASAAPAGPSPRPTPPAQRAAPTAAYQTWTTAPGESLESLAAALFPGQPAARERFIDEVVRANPTLFPDRGARSLALEPGTELLVPDPARLRIPAPTATARPKRAAGALGAPAPAATPSRPAPPPDAPQTDRLVVQMTNDRPATDAGTASHSGNDVDARERQLLTAIDRSIQAQLELLERIRELERLQAELIERANRLGTIPVTAPNPPAVEQPAAQPELTAKQPPDARPSRDWPLFLALFAASVAVLFGWQRLAQRRRRAALAHQTAAEATTEPPAALWPDDARVASGLESARAVADAERAAAQPQPAPPAYAWAAPSVAPIAVEDDIEEHESAVELAEIMMSFGRVQGAAETLAEFLRSNPRRAVQPWLKLLDVYRAAGMRAEFDGLARQLNKTFNVQTVTWDNYDAARAAAHHIEDMPHLVDTLVRTWRTVECQAYLEKLLRDNRDGTRQGFPLSVVDELLTLAAVLEAQLGRYRPPEAAG